MNAPPRYWMNRKVISNEDINREKQNKKKSVGAICSLSKRVD